jgi:hypothetical protein
MRKTVTSLSAKLAHAGPSRRATMINGAEIPFRRRYHQRATGSLIFDRQRDEHVREARQDSAMRIWMKGHFVRT